MGHTQVHAFARTHTCRHHPYSPRALVDVSRSCLLACTLALMLGDILRVRLTMLAQTGTRWIPGLPFGKEETPLSSQASLFLLPDPPPQPTGPCTPQSTLCQPCWLLWGPRPEALGAGSLCSAWQKEVGQATSLLVAGAERGSVQEKLQYQADQDLEHVWGKRSRDKWKFNSHT